MRALFGDEARATVANTNAHGRSVRGPGPGFPANYLGRIDPGTGHIAPVHVSGPAFEPQGLLFLP
jgi:hypothetical protein